MNYLIRESRLFRAIADHYERGCKKEKSAEFDKVKDLLKELSYEYSNFALRAISRMMDKGNEDPSDPVVSIYRKMCTVNDMCARYGVDPMFPEAVGKPKRSEIADALKVYMDQIMTVDRHSHDALGKAVETHIFTEYTRLCDYLTENVEEIMERDRAGE